MNWLGRISNQRIEAQQAGKAEAKAPAQVEVPATAFAQTLLSDKLVKKHGSEFAPASSDMQALVRAGQHLHTHRAAQFGNAVDQFYTAQARSTEALSPEDRTKTISASVIAMRHLVERYAGHPSLMPAMAALSSLLEPKGKPDRPPALHARQANEMVKALVDSLDGRQGVGSTLFGFRNLVEAYESCQDGLKSSARPEIWSQVAQYLGDVVPKQGCDQGELGRVVGLCQRALRESPADPVAALALARKSAFKQLEGPLLAAKTQIVESGKALEPESPHKLAHQSLSAAFTSVLDNNPAGPAELVERVEHLHAVVCDHIHGIDDAQLQGYRSLAKVIELAGDSPAATSILTYLADNVPGLIDDPSARKHLARAGRIKNSESLAPVLIEAQAALIAQDVGQAGLAAAIAKFKRLPPGPALNAALVLMSHLDGPHSTQVADALFIESRVAETPQGLTEFADRFSAALDNLGEKLGSDTNIVATALAKDGAGGLDPVVAGQVGDLCAEVKGLLPKADISKLLERGRDGAAGLLLLIDSPAYVHDPQPMLFDLLKALPARAGLPEIRLAMGMAGQLGAFDRDPKATDFPRILEDFTEALSKPRILTAAPTAGAAHEVKGKRTTLCSFTAAHPAIPVELAATAGRSLSNEQMGWLNKTLGSTRSHAFARVVRDTVFAAVKTDNLGILQALARPDLDSKVMQKTATFIAQEHRQNQAEALPFERMIEGLNKGQDPVAAIEAEKAAKALEGLDFGAVEGVSLSGVATIEKVKPQLEALLGFFDTERHNLAPDHFMPHLQSMVRGHVDGTWPAQKYESAPAKEHLKGLSEQQLAIWSSEMVTAAGAPAAADTAESVAAVQLLKGVLKKLRTQVSPKQVRGAKPMSWSRGSLDVARKDHKGLLGKLRGCRKGSKNHGILSRRMRPVQDRVELLELFFALKETFAQDPGSSQAVLTRIKPFALAAQGALGRLGQPGFVQALQEAAEVAVEAPVGAKGGLYVSDEDQMEAYLTSFDRGSCINPSDGFNRASLVEFMCGSQYKMIRSMDGDKSKSRAFLRLVRMELPNGYKGHVLWMDNPMGTPNGYPSDDDRHRMYAHAAAKAKAMGIPFGVKSAGAQPAVEEQGLKLEQANSTVRLHRGVTGVHQSEGLGTGDYFIGWPGMDLMSAFLAPSQDDREVVRPVNCQIAMPPSWKK